MTVDTPSVHTCITVNLAAEPQGLPKDSDFDVVRSEFDVAAASLPNDDDVLVEMRFVSVDPYLRGRMRVGAKSYVESFRLGEPISSGCVATVVRSNNADFPVGSVVAGSMPWSTFSVIPHARGLTKLSLPPSIPLSYALGCLGMPGLTAYASLLKIGEPKQGETLFVSAAGGAVGLVVCQIGKILGLRVVACAGDDAKIDYLINEIGVDAAFNYKSGNIGDLLDKHCPQGIDINFEQVGGEILDAVLTRMNTHGRIVACGMISQYNATPETAYGVKNLMTIVGRRLKFQGFIVSDFYAEMFQPFIRDVTGWIADGKLKYRETVTEGLENLPKAFIGMLNGENFGKAVVKA